MKISELLRRMFVERYCVICGEPISYDVKEGFCEECYEHWREFLRVKCRICGRPHYQCTCLPSKVRKINHGIAGWCVFYDASTNGEINKLFSYLKRRYDRQVINLCAERMKDTLIGLYKGRGIGYNDYVVTYAPRRRKSVKKYGFDQSERLAKALANKLGIKCISTFKNVAKIEQKNLSKKERAYNAQGSYIFKEGSLKEYKNIILVDDIMTSGATLYACAFQLYKHGARSVVPVTFAKDNYRAKGVRKNVKRNTKYHFTRAIKGFVRNGSQ